uniref:Uncharacterized protein n=1 Tax=Arundo donax TaxID=35708 RepID=A0A0A8ZDH5_ARUDO
MQFIDALIWFLVSSSYGYCGTKRYSSTQQSFWFVEHRFFLLQAVATNCLMSRILLLRTLYQHFFFERNYQHIAVVLMMMPAIIIMATKRTLLQHTSRCRILTKISQLAARLPKVVTVKAMMMATSLQYSTFWT